LDFSGGSGIHVIGGGTSLIGVILVGPRMGRFGKDGAVKNITGYSKAMICLGTFILWFGWFGFNPGSTRLLTNGQSLVAARCAITTLLSAGTSGISMFFISRVLLGCYDLSLVMNGILSGLVSVTACCAFVDHWAAVVIGAIAPIIYISASRLLVWLKLDDPVDAIPVHLCCGIYGTLVLGLFARKEYIDSVHFADTDEYGLFFGGGIEQFGIQAMGTLIIFVWSVLNALFVFVPFRLMGRIRISAEREAGIIREKMSEDSWARVEVMDNGRLDQFQFRVF